MVEYHTNEVMALTLADTQCHVIADDSLYVIDWFHPRYSDLSRWGNDRRGNDGFIQVLSLFWLIHWDGLLQR